MFEVMAMKNKYAGVFWERHYHFHFLTGHNKHGVFPSFFRRYDFVSSAHSVNQLELHPMNMHGVYLIPHHVIKFPYLGGASADNFVYTFHFKRPSIDGMSTHAAPMSTFTAGHCRNIKSSGLHCV